MSVRVQTSQEGRLDDASVRPEPPVRAGRARALRTVMTCDIPVVEQRSVLRTPLSGEVCFPTGRPERRMRASRRGVLSHSVSETRLPSAEVFRRRRWAGALLVGGALACLVWAFVLVGASYQDAAMPAGPAATQVVYVRAGESLTDLAQRIAPELPPVGVIAALRELNGLETSGLAVGQALVVPRYR